MSDDGYVDRARALLDARLEALRPLVRARQALADLEAQLAEARRVDAQAAAAAVRAGWSEAELRTVGLAAPAGRTGGLPARPGRQASRPRVEPGVGVGGGDVADPGEAS